VVRKPERLSDRPGGKQVIIKAAWVVPITAPPIQDGFVEISGGLITGVGPAGSLGWRAADHDLGQAVLTPGLVNPHTHLELTAYAGMLKPAPFWKWIEELIWLRRKPGRRERESLGATEGAWQSLWAGVTCVGDISRENVSWAALKTVPIRKVCFVELLSLADEPPRNTEELRTAVAEVKEDELLTAGVTPHAPYTVPGEQIRAAVSLAGELNRPWCTHWAETAEEVAYLRGDVQAIPLLLRMLLKQCGVRSPVCSPGEYLEHCAGGLRPGLLAHANYVDELDIARLAAAGHSVAYCPRAHAFFGHDTHPFQRLCAAGVKATIGTDSAASNDDLSMLHELRHVRRNSADPPPPEILLQMATLDAAKALGLAGQIGSLEKGKAADMAAFPCAARTTDPIADLIDRAPSPTAVWVAGTQVV
jgi:cytosine/adenosine deaminase-related metal-dependent hydrolase